MKQQLATLFFALIMVTLVPMQGLAQGPCPDVVATQCFGDCGGSNVLTYTVPGGQNGNRQFCVDGLGGNLCGLISASAQVTVNGRTVASGNISSGIVRFRAKSGDFISVEVTAQTDPRIVCIVGGSYSFQLSTRL